MGTGSTYTPAALSSNTYYQVVVSCGGQTVTTNPAEIVVGMVSSDWSYVRTRDIVRPGITDMTTANNLTDPADVKQVTEYLDGLGRPIQEVAMKASPAENDMVSVHVYDAIGREPLKYLPYTSPSNDGNFKTDPYAEQQTFNAGQFPGEQFFGSETVYEASPLNRPLTTYAPGNSWAGSGRGVGTAYLVNTSNDSVVLWTIASAPGSVPVSQGNYAAGTLYVTPTTDENGHQVIEYKDEQGKTLLKKVQLWDAPASGPSGWLNTYYVYDTLDNLRFVVPPKAVDWLKINGWSFGANGGQAVDSELCFRYEYDYRQRMTVKKVPGAGETWMAYDIRDRLVMTEDANLRQAGQWLVTQYDRLNRPVETGLILYASTLANLQQLVTNKTANGGSTFAEPVDTTISGTNTTGDIRAARSITGENGFSTADGGTFIGEIVNGNWGSGASTSNSNSISLSPVPSGVTLQPLTVTYYDDYNWVSGSGTGLPSTFASVAGKTNDFIASYNVGPVNAEPVTPMLVTRGEVTGTQTLVLGSNGQYLSSINFYDDRARLIQMQSINYTGGLDTVTTQYDFSGKPLRTLLGQAKRTNTAQYHQVLTKTNYDAGFRVTSIWKNIDGAASDQVIDSVQYNELGQLSTKSLGKDPTTGQPLDNLVYDYNVRGWVTGINRAYVAGTAQHYFGMELGYDNATSVAGTTYSTPAYNGNIAGTIWKSAGDGVNRKYDFSYDDVNRLTGAAYLDNHSGTGWDTSAMNYSVSGLTYDDNGNILSMIQKGFKISNPTGPIDSLTYTYTANSNKLLQVHDEFNDTASVLGDFHYKGTKQAYDYRYDANGSLNLDNNKGIDTIVYNYLNLPQRVHMKGKGNILYTYDALGEKLSKQTIDSAAGLATTTLYLDGFQYQRRTTLTNTTGGADTLQFVGHEEGRLRWAFQNLGNGDSAYSWQYDFYERDNLGDTRVVLTQEQETDQYPAATMEVGDSSLENLYYTNLDETRSALPVGYPTDTTTNPNHYVSQLASFGSAPQIGPGIVLKVMAGDHFSIKTSSWWRTGPPTPQQVPSVASDLVSALIAGMSHVPGEGATAGGMASSPTLTPSVLDFLADTGKVSIDESKPHAFLNWILFDNQFNYVSASSGCLQVGTAGSIDKMVVTNLPVNSSGFLYIYVNNASPNVPVFFDNLQVTHVRGPLLEENHYYPFGLLMSGISDKAIKTNYAENKYRFNGGVELQNKEFSDGSGLEEYDATFRMYDPQIGRFWQSDPLADINEDYSPYSFANDNPINYNDPLGLAPGKQDTGTNQVNLPPAVVTPPKTPPRTQVTTGLADTGGGNSSVNAGPAPATAVSPIQLQEEKDEELSDAYRKVIGYDPNDPIDQLEHTVVRKPSFWDFLFSEGGLIGYNAFDKPVYQPYYGGVAPADGSFNRMEGIAELLKFRNMRSWEDLFEWGHNFEILEKLKNVSSADITRLKNAGVTLEQLETWSKVYGAAVIKRAGSSNVIAKYRLDLINKLISLW